ncbi:MAG TPA: branched-chain amino acid ABC transporter permease [Anaerolineales bacterium]|nr:branched-chain amino acid ABC transporter permease [Anaerolineales bacterium]
MTPSEQLAQYIVSGITQGSIYALIALGFVTIFNVTGIINFSQGEFAVIGAFLAITVAQKVSLFRGQLPVALEWPLPLAILVGVLGAILVGMLLYRFGIQPARHASVLSQIVVTIGASIALRGMVLLAWGTDPYRLAPFTAAKPLRLFGAVITRQSLWVMGLTFVAVVGLYFFFRFTMLGKALRASSANPDAARLMGINTRRMGLVAFALSAALGALGGIVITPSIFMTYDRGLMLSLKGFVAMIMGGLTDPFGAVIGGLLLGTVESLAAGLISSGYRDAFTFVVLFLVLLLRLGGLVGRKTSQELERAGL